MVDEGRTLLARFMVKHLSHPRAFVIATYLWLAAGADDLEEKRRCLNEVLRPDPENQAATLALLLLDQRRPTS